MATANSNRGAPAPERTPVNRRQIEQQIDDLHGMTVRELKERYAEVFGQQTGTHHKRHLIRLIAWRIQELAEGGLSERARQRAAELACDADVRIRPPKDFDAEPRTSVRGRTNTNASSDTRLPSVGTAIVRDYKGRRLEVTVLADGFEYEGQRYRSLSAVAKSITGAHCNGFRFFGLKETS